MDDALRTLDPALAARLAELEALVAAQRDALEAERYAQLVSASGR